MNTKKNSGNGKVEILIAEDSPTQAEQLKYLLEKHGYQVLAVGNGKEAFDLMQQHKPTIVISDIIMPEMDGYELCRQVKANAELKNVPFILLTVLSNPEDVIRGLECGADNFITKPYDEKYLISRINYLLANMHLQEIDESQVGLTIHFGKQKYFISSNRLQIFNLLLSTYETAIQKNRELERVQEELRKLNEQLEERVKERTSELTAEVEERKRLGENIKKQYAILKSIIESPNTPVFSVDRNYRYTSFNSSHATVMKSIYGVDIQMGRSLLDYMTVAEDRETAKKNLDHALKGEHLIQEAYSGEESLNRRYFEVSHNPIIGADGMVIGVAVFASDLTERKHAEERIKAERDKAQKYLDIAGAIITVIDLEGKVSLINKRGCEVLGYKEEEIIGKNWFDNFIPPWIKSELISVSKKLLSGEIELFEYYENPILTKSGEERLIAWHNAILKDDKGNVTSHISSGEDITERKRAEEELRKSEERYRTLFEQSMDAVYISTPEGRFVDVNQSMLDIFGYTRKDMMKMDIRKIYANPTDRTKFQQEIKQTGFVRDYEIKFRKKDNAEIDCLVSSVLRLANDRSILGYQGIIHDITKRKKMEKELEQSCEKLKGAMDGITQAIAATTEMRDPYTAGHQRRMTHLACSLAREMGLSDDLAEGIRVAGSLHDIGKIQVPAEILAKPGQLTDLEFSIIKNHVQAGYEILRPIEFPWPVAQTVLQHHERMDGSGYPRGLSDDDIIIEARLLAVADVVEAMSSHRPYRPALGIDKALEEISQNKGTLYDADVVAACLSLFKEKGFQFK